MPELRRETLGFGDARAPLGSEEWAKRWRLEFHGAAIDPNPELVTSQYRLGEKFRAWEKLTDRNGKPFPTFDAFCEAPMPYGAGVSPRRVRAYIAMVEGKAAALEFAASTATPAPSHSDSAVARVAKGKKGFKPASNIGDNITNAKRGSTGAEYLTARIARDAPAVLERMKRGEFKSVRAAARAAGILKPIDPVRVAVRVVAKMTTEQRAAFFDAMMKAYGVQGV